MNTIPDHSWTVGTVCVLRSVSGTVEVLKLENQSFPWTGSFSVIKESKYEDSSSYSKV